MLMLKEAGIIIKENKETGKEKTARTERTNKTKRTERTKRSIKKESNEVSKILNMMMEAELPKSERNNGLISTMRNMRIPDDKINIMYAMLATIVDKGVTGDMKAADWVIEKMAEILPDQSPIYSGIPGHLLGKAYVDIYRDIRERRHRFYDFKGGRGSLKSSFCALVMIDEIMRNPNFCGIALRQIKETIADSVYAQLVWAIEKLGFKEYFKYTASSSSMQIKRIDTGQIIYFKGCGDPVKIKSIKPPKGMYIGVVWFEEKDQLTGIEAVRNIQQSVMRGGDDIIVLSSYNTPLSRKHFLNRLETGTESPVSFADTPFEKGADKNKPNKFDKTDRVIHHSFYYDSPVEWLGQPFLDEAKYLKEVNEKAYRHEYLGEAIGEGGNVFENVIVKRFDSGDHKKIQESERFYFGVDWGFYPDPWAFVKCCYYKKERALYIVDEAMAYRKSNRETFEILSKEKFLTKDDLIICDSSEPKSITDYMSFGLYARGAEKNSGSVKYSMKWLQGLGKIVVDTQKCPNAAKEFSEYEYEKGADGEIISGYPDQNNHFIDAVRYATNLLWRRE